MTAPACLFDPKKVRFADFLGNKKAHGITMSGI